MKEFHSIMNGKLIKTMVYIKTDINPFDQQVIFEHCRKMRWLKHTQCSVVFQLNTRKMAIGNLLVSVLNINKYYMLLYKYVNGFL